MSPQKGFNALISSVYNQDLVMLDMILQSTQIYALSDYQNSSWFESFYQYFHVTVSNRQDYEGNRQWVDQYRPRRDSIQLKIDLPGRNQMTALHYAAQIGDTRLVGRLLQAGASREVRNHKSHLPIDIAVTNKHTAAADALRYDPEKVSICLAAKHGDWTVMQALLVQGISINTKREHFHKYRTTELQHELYTPLIAAVAFGQGDLVKHMLEVREIDVNLPNLLGQTPLMYAATRGDENIVIKLLKHGANRYEADRSDHTALYWAEKQLAEEQALPVATVVADKGSTVATIPSTTAAIASAVPAPSSGSTNNNTTASDAAADSQQRIKRLEKVIAILKNDPQRQFIHDVIRKNDFPGVVAMLKQGVDPNQKRMTLIPIQDSSEHWLGGATTTSTGTGGEGSHQKQSVSRRASTNSVSTSTATSTPPPLDRRHSTNSSRSKSGKTESPSINGINPNSLEIQLIHEIDPFDEQRFIAGETPLMVAARYNRQEILALLIKAPSIDLNLRDSYGHSALFYAAVKGREEATLLLLKAKANRRQLNNKNQTAIDYALAMNYLQIAALIEADPYYVHIHDVCEEGKLYHVLALLKQGCPPNFRDERPGRLSQTPLMAAALGGKVEVVKMLLRYPEVMAGKDDRDSFGVTALMKAAGKGALDVTGVLLNAGCDRNLKDNNGLTAKDHASRHSYSVMFQFMGQSMVR